MVNGKRLLLVEDDAATRDVLTLLLAGEGWQVDAVESGEAALAAVTRDLIWDVVLCDLRLPGVCGPALAAALRERLAGGTTVLLAMTATPHAEAGAGYDGWATKPFPAAAIEAKWKLVREWQTKEAAESRGKWLAASSDGAVGDQAIIADIADSQVGVDRGAVAAGAGSAIPDAAVRREATREGAILDEKTVEQLRRAMGDTGMRGLYAFALADAGDRLSRMNAAAQAGDSDTYVREAHALKGSSGMIGARHLCRLAGNAEMEGLEGESLKKVLRMHVATEELRLMLETLFSV